MSTTVTSPAERLRGAIDALCRDPTVTIEELRWGPPASPEALAAASRLPADLLGFYAEIDGVDFAWRSRHDHSDNGGLHIPPIADVSRPLAHEFGEPVDYVMIDDLRDGYACYYEIDHSKPKPEVSVIHAEAAFVAGTVSTVCKTFTEYLALAAAHRFHWTWLEEQVMKAWREEQAARK